MTAGEPRAAQDIVLRHYSSQDAAAIREVLLDDVRDEVYADIDDRLPLAGSKLHVDLPEPVADSPAGRAFLRAEVVEVPQTGGVRMYLPLLDSSVRWV